MTADQLNFRKGEKIRRPPVCFLSTYDMKWSRCTGLQARVSSHLIEGESPLTILRLLTKILLYHR